MVPTQNPKFTYKSTIIPLTYNNKLNIKETRKRENRRQVKKFIFFSFMGSRPIWPTSDFNSVIGKKIWTGPKHARTPIRSAFLVPTTLGDTTTLYQKTKGCLASVLKQQFFFFFLNNVTCIFTHFFIHVFLYIFSNNNFQFLNTYTK